MGETIINSNQVRASGDTSTQTLINENQVRQSGDSSSQTLLNKNQIAQSQGTLNAEIVGTPTISDDFILSNFDSSNYLKFNPTSPNNNAFEIRAKFRIADLTKKGCIFMCSPDQTGIKLTYGGDGVGQYGLSFLVTTGVTGTSWGNTGGTSEYQATNVYTVANQWMWVKLGTLIDGNNNRYVYLEISTDGTNYTRIKQVFCFNGAGNFANLTYEQIGTNDGSMTAPNSMEIDLKEVKFYINGTLSWEAVSF